MKTVLQSLNTNDINQINELIVKYKYDQFRLYPAKSPDAWRKYLLYRLKNYLKDENRKCVVATQQEKVLGLIALRESTWDSSHFGFKIGIIDYLITQGSNYLSEIAIKKKLLKYCDDWCKTLGIRFISCRIGGDDISGAHGLESSKFKYIETILWPIIDFKAIYLEKSFYVVRNYNKSDIVSILRIAGRDQYQRGRYHADPGFHSRRADALYAKWAKQSINSNDGIAVIEVDNNIGGYFIYRLDKELSNFFGFRYGRWCSAAISSEVRGKQVGYNLFLGLLHIMKQRCDIVDSGFAGKNILSMNLHWKLGFKVVYEAVTFHKWFK